MYTSKRLNQQDECMLHAWMQDKIANVEQTTFGYASKIDDSLDQSEEDLKEMVFLRSRYVITAIDDAANSFCILNRTHHLQ